MQISLALPIFHKTLCGDEAIEGLEVISYLIFFALKEFSFGAGRQSSILLSPQIPQVETVVGVNKPH